MDAMLRDHLVQPMIVVAPNGSGGWLHDSEMLSRAIGGISSGAYGVLNLGLRHPDLFSVILGEMPYGDPGPVAGRLLGGSRALWLANPPDAYSRGWPSTTRWRSTCSPAPATPPGPRPAGWWPCSRPAARRPSTRFTPGANHAWRGVRAELPDALAFASQHLHVPPVDRPVIEAVDRP
jgi:hypothetical protein